MNGVTRRYAHEAGDTWSKWGDPAYIAGLDYERRERRWFAATVWTWAVAIGAWAAILVYIGGKP